MTQQRSWLHVGLADFAERTLLLIGDTNSLSWLAEQIDTRRDIKLTEMHQTVRLTGVGLRLIPTIHRGRLTRLGEAFDWEISADEAPQLARQLRELATATTPAHAYLDPQSNTTDVQVVASKGEYDPEKVFVA